MRLRVRSGPLTLAIILICAFVFSLFTVFIQSREMGFDRLQEGGFQVDNHNKMLAGHRGDPRFGLTITHDDRRAIYVESEAANSELIMLEGRLFR